MNAQLLGVKSTLKVEIAKDDQGFPKVLLVMGEAEGVEAGTTEVTCKSLAEEAKNDSGSGDSGGGDTASEDSDREDSDDTEIDTSDDNNKEPNNQSDNIPNIQDNQEYGSDDLINGYSSSDSSDNN